MSSRTRAVRLIAAVVIFAACGGSPAASVPTTTTVVVTTTTLPDPAFVPPECADTPAITVASGVSDTTIAAPAPLTTDQQLDVLNGVDNAVRDQYVYPDFNGTDWDSAVAALASRVEAGIDAAAFYQAIDELVASLGDDHSYHESPAEVIAGEAELAATHDYVGIGSMVLPVQDKGLVTVLAVFPGSAAEHAGLQIHDNIHVIDGVPLTEPGAYTKLRGPECSLIVMEVSSPGGSDRVLTAIRFRVEGGIPVTSRLVPTEDGTKIGYILIPTLADGSADDQARAALEGFGELDGLILDLRVNGGGSSSVLVPLLALFNSGTLGDFVSRDGTRPLEIAADGVQNSQTVPLIVLIDEDTESYAEVLAGTLSAEGRAVLIGETSQGNVETLTGYELEDGSKLWLAHETFVPRADPGAGWERSGVVPDVVVASAWEEFTFETDPAIEAALEVFAAG